MSENGNHVTRAELKAHLDPIRSDVWEIKADVKMLLLRSAGSDAVAKRKRRISDRFLAYAAIVGALIAPLAWGAAAHL